MEFELESTLNNKKKFINFLSLKNLFIKNKEPDIKLILQKQADLFLEADNLPSYIKMMSEGYQPTKNQSDRLTQIINNFLVNPRGSNLDEGKGIKYVEDLLKLGLQLNFDNIHHLFLYPQYYNNDFFKNIHTAKESNLYSDNYYWSKSLVNIDKQVKQLMESPDFPDYLFSKFISDLNNKKNNYHQIFQVSDKYPRVLNYYSPILVNNPELLLKNVSFKDFNKIYEILQSKNIHDHIAIFNEIINNYYSKDINNLLTITKQNYTSELLENLTIQKINNDKHLLTHLPKEALDTIENIEAIFQKIQIKKLNNPNDLEQLNNMIKKRIPEVLSKFLTIDEEYRTTLKNTQGLNAQELMLESLKNIHCIFEKIHKEINQESVHSLSVTNRYTKALK